jgi:U3 small nucleolar RNA-associated protein 19
MKMIHSQSTTSASTDPYDFNTSDPYNCQAIDSSLWELQSLSQHYYSNVSTLAKIFTEQFLKPKYNLEDFLDHTYATVRITTLPLSLSFLLHSHLLFVIDLVLQN